MKTASTTNCSGPGDRSVVALFDDRDAAEYAVDALRRANFDSDAIGYAMRGSDAVHGGMISDASGAKDGKGALVGAATGSVLGGVLAATVAMIPGVGPVLAAGVLAAFFGGAAAGAAVGGIFGAMTGLGISEEEARYYEKRFQEGKAVVAVRAGDRYADAIDILTRHGGQRVFCQPGTPVHTVGVFSTP